MTGKSLVKNLSAYVAPILGLPVYSFDRNASYEVPCIVIGYDSDNGGELTYIGNYTVDAWVRVIYQGYDDPENGYGDTKAIEVLNTLANKTAILSSLNAPLSGTDTRPARGFGMYDYSFPSITREQEDHSEVIKVSFEAYTVAADF
jgi:hypothetical protein